MKATVIFTGILALVIVGIAPALAQVEVKGPRPVVGGGEMTIEFKSLSPQEKCTYLGVVASAAPAALRQQLKLPAEVGLVVESVNPTGPAAAAGLKPSDVLHKLDDQLLINSEQLQALVRSCKAGDSVKLSLFRQAQPVELTAKLTEQAVFDRPVAPFGHNGPQDVLVWRAPNGLAAGDAGPLRIALQAPGMQETTEWSDDQHTLRLQREDGVTKSLEVTDKAGNPLLKGPVQTPEQRAALPADIRQKLEKAEQAAPARMFRLRLQPGAGRAAGRVKLWQDDQHILVVRGTPQSLTYLLALSKKDGRTVYDGPVDTPEQRQSMPGEIAEKFEALARNPDMAREFGAK